VARVQAVGPAALAADAISMTKTRLGQVTSRVVQGVLPAAAMVDVELMTKGIVPPMVPVVVTFPTLLMERGP